MIWIKLEISFRMIYYIICFWKSNFFHNFVGNLEKRTGKILDFPKFSEKMISNLIIWSKIMKMGWFDDFDEIGYTLLVYSNMCGKKFSLYDVHIPRKSLDLCYFTHAPVPHLKLLVDFFGNLFPPRQKGWRKLWFALPKFGQKIWRWLGTLVYFHLVWL